jgi:hypothetical protein
MVRQVGSEITRFFGEFLGVLPCILFAAGGITSVARNTFCSITTRPLTGVDSCRTGRAGVRTYL